jgi:hypothetical protein
MDDLTNKSVANRKRKAIAKAEGKENDGNIEIID